MLKYTYKINSTARSLQLVEEMISNHEILIKLFKKYLRELESLIIYIVSPMCSKNKVL